MTLGQEFGTYAVTIGEDRARLAEADLLIHEINLGATAIGTGLNAPAGLRRGRVPAPAPTSPASRWSRRVDLIEATQDVGAFVHLSGVLKRVAVKLSKVCNDLRLLSSGPRAGLGEINLPAGAVRLLDHARQGQPGHPRSRQPGGLRGHRQRRHHHDGRRVRAAPAQRLRADHRPQPAQEHVATSRPPAAPSRPAASGGITANTEHLRAHGRAVHRPRHRAQPAPGLRHGHGHRPGSPRHRQAASPNSSSNPACSPPSSSPTSSAPQRLANLSE